MGLKSYLSGVLNAARGKTAPTIPGGFGKRDVGRLDAYGTQRVPTKQEQIEQYRGVVYACSNINARAVASVPMRLYVQTSDGQHKARCPTKKVDSHTKARLKDLPYLKRRLTKAVEIEEVLEHPFLTLLETVNDQMDGFELLELTDLYCELSGIAFWYPIKNALGVPVEIWIIPSHVVNAHRDSVTGFVDYWMVGANQKRYELDELIAFRFPSPLDPYGEGWSPARACWESASLINKSYSKSLAMMDNNARPDILFSPKEFIGDAEASRLEKQINKKYRQGGSGGILVADSNLDAKILNYSPRDMEMLALYGVSKIELANAYDVPMSLLETKDVNRANAEAGHYQHAKLGVRPRVVRFGARLTSKVCPLYDPTGRLFVAFDDPVPDDEEKQTIKRKAELETGQRTINELRYEDGLEPVAWGDEPWLPFNVMQPSQMEEQAERDAETALAAASGDDKEKDDDKDD